MGYATILLEKADGIATLTLNRPEARNAVDLAMRHEILAALEDLEADDAVRVMVLTGAGEHFCAGLVPDGAGTYFLPRVVGLAAFFEKRLPRFRGD